jgi:hypothetical protein
MTILSHTFHLSIHTRHQRLLGRLLATPELAKEGLDILAGFRLILFLLVTQYSHHSLCFPPVQAIQHPSGTRHGTHLHMAFKVLDMQ